jgi:hypothetical protein
LRGLSDLENASLTIHFSFSGTRNTNFFPESGSGKRFQDSAIPRSIPRIEKNIGVFWWKLKKLEKIA